MKTYLQIAASHLGETSNRAWHAQKARDIFWAATDIVAPGHPNECSAYSPTQYSRFLKRGWDGQPAVTVAQWEAATRAAALTLFPYLDQN